MRAKYFTIFWLTVFFTGSLYFSALNWLIDPLWLFSHDNTYNERQWGFDERQQKTNRIRFQPFDYDALMIGSSRSSYISQSEFTQNRVFNYSASAMRPKEFGQYIDFARTTRGKDFAVIYLGLDFFATNKNHISNAAPASRYLTESAKPLYRLEAILSHDTYKKSMTNLRNAALEEQCDCYNRANVKSRGKVSQEAKASAIANDLSSYRTTVYGPNYDYDHSLKSILLELRRSHPETKFVAFTTPPSAELFRVLVESGRLPDYDRWITELTEVFGGIYDFMGVNSVTADLDNYADAHHFYPKVGRMIARRIEGQADVPADFGVFVTRDGLAKHFNDIHLQAQRLLSPP